VRLAHCDAPQVEVGFVNAQGGLEIIAYDTFGNARLMTTSTTTGNIFIGMISNDGTSLIKGVLIRNASGWSEVWGLMGVRFVVSSYDPECCQ
jgi:hypothetical protein